MSHGNLTMVLFLFSSIEATRIDEQQYFPDQRIWSWALSFGICTPNTWLGMSLTRYRVFPSLCLSCCFPWLSKKHSGILLCLNLYYSIKADIIMYYLQQKTRKHMSYHPCRWHGYPWPSLATSPYRSSPLAGVQGCILYPHIAAICIK